MAEPGGGEPAAKALALLDVLLRLAGAPFKGVDDEWLRTHLGLPPAMTAELLRRFTESAAEPPPPARGGGASQQPQQHAQLYKVSKPLKDLLIAYILVLALHVDNFELDLTGIAAALCLDPTKLAKPMAALGVKNRRSPDGVNRAVLMPDVKDGMTLTNFLPDTTTRPTQAKRR